LAKTVLDAAEADGDSSGKTAVDDSESKARHRKLLLYYADEARRLSVVTVPHDSFGKSYLGDS